MDVQVTGRVQGVAFRYYTQQKAQALGLRGYVRNRADGSVQVVAQGDAAALAALRVWLAHGSPAARVTGVHEAPYAGDERFVDFVIRR